VSFGSEILRLYDEWDSLQKRMGEDKANPAEQVFYRMSVRTTAGDVAGPQVTVPFRILAAAADVTQGNLEQLFRVVRAQVGDDGSAGQIQEEVEPRLSCAIDWAVSFQPEDERTRVRSQPAGPSEVVMGDQNVAGLRLLLDRLDDHWSPDGLTTLVYGVPKLLGGLPLDAPTNDMIKKLQREFFVLLSTGCWSMRRPGRDSRPCSSPSGRSRWSASCRRSLNRRRPRLTLTRGGSDPDGAV
jgi:lysyl-tRNA synthetase class 1